jgi:uncharacterized protein
MKCPICRKPVEASGAEVPFCSERCRLIDLGKWSSEEYVVSTPLRPEDHESTQRNDDER